MPIRIEAYTATGIVTGTIPTPGHLRDTLEAAPELSVTGADFAPLDGRPPEPPADRVLVIDDLVIATSDEALPGLVHAAWHDVVIEAGPYRIEGELATLPGFDPGRALTRPTGEFVHLRDVAISLIERPETDRATYPEGLVNRYLVDVVESDLMLGFFFPGARMEGAGALPPPPSPAAGAGTHGELQAPAPGPAEPAAQPDPGSAAAPTA
jgi:hypothetical protein